MVAFLAFLQVIERALKFVTPSASEIRKLDLVSKKVGSLIISATSGVKPAPDIILGGSYARGTWI